MTNSIFTSPREKRIWMGVLIIVIAIFLSLVGSRPLLEFFKSQQLQAAVFLMGMISIGGIVFWYGIFSQSRLVEWILLLGIGTVYFLLFLRLGLPERSHLIEYSVLALVIHQALTERKKQIETIPFLNLIAFFITSLIGVLDEFAQLFIPERRFDLEDILFNCLAIFFAIGASALVKFVRSFLTKKSKE